MSVAVRTRIELGPEEIAFVDLIARGVSLYDAAEQAGFDRGMAVQVAERPAVVAAMDANVRLNLRRGAVASASYLADVSSGLQNSNGPRIDASKAVLDRTGYNVPSARPAPRFADADLSELSADELRRLVDGLERARDKTIGALGDKARPVNATLDTPQDAMLLNLLD